MASTTQGKRDTSGAILGVVVFLGGTALLVLTFKLAYDMYRVPPGNALDIRPGKVLDPGAVGNSLTVIILRVLLLLIMGIVASLIANKGILLYTHSRAATIHVDTKE